MIKQISIIAIAALSACNSNNTNTTTESNNSDSTHQHANQSEVQNIAFTVANNYFVKNTFKPESLKDPKITTQQQFDEIFGMATVMGENGKPTPIDFSKQYVIAVIGKETNMVTNFKAESLTKKDDTILFKYQIIEGEKTTSTMVPLLLIIVDNTHTGKVELEFFQVK